MRVEFGRLEIWFSGNSWFSAPCQQRSIATNQIFWTRLTIGVAGVSDISVREAVADSSKRLEPDVTQVAKRTTTPESTGAVVLELLRARSY